MIFYSKGEVKQILIYEIFFVHMRPFCLLNLMKNNFLFVLKVKVLEVLLLIGLEYSYK